MYHRFCPLSCKRYWQLSDSGEAAKFILSGIWEALRPPPGLLNWFLGTTRRLFCTTPTEIQEDGGVTANGSGSDIKQEKQNRSLWWDEVAKSEWLWALKVGVSCISAGCVVNFLMIVACLFWNFPLDSRGFRLTLRCFVVEISLLKRIEFCSRAGALFSIIQAKFLVSAVGRCAGTFYCPWSDKSGDPHLLKHIYM